jgi:hypothetical protein
MSEIKGPETQDNVELDPQSREEDRGEEISTEPEPLKDVIESDQAVEPDAKEAEELMILNKKQRMIVEYAMIPESTTGKKQQQRRRQRQKETLFNISKQLDRQTAEIKRISSLLQSIQKHIKLPEDNDHDKKL